MTDPGAKREGTVLVRRKILACEDDALLLWALGEELNQAGYDVTLVPDGEAALALLVGEDFDAAVLDYQLPGLNGLQILDALDRENRKLPVVMISGNESRELRAEANRRGIVDLMEKPLAFDRLRDLLGRIPGRA
jgi:DNA-binding response OmpR family regulator